MPKARKLQIALEATALCSETFKRYQWEFVIWFTARRNSQAMAIVWWARPFSKVATWPWAKWPAPADASIKVHEIFMKRTCKWINSHFSCKNEALLSIDSLVGFGCFTTLVSRDFPLCPPRLSLRSRPIHRQKFWTSATMDWNEHRKYSDGFDDRVWQTAVYCSADTLFRSIP